MATLPSLFGGSLSPQDMQNQLVNERASQFSQLTPNQQLSQMAYKAGAGLGTGVAGAFGVDTTDPMIKQATQIRQLASQFDTNTPEGMAKFAEALRPLNPEASLKAAQQAVQMRGAMADVQKKELSASQEASLRNELALLGPDATQEDIMKVVTKYGSADKILTLLQTSADKQVQNQMKVDQAKAANDARVEAARIAGESKEAIARLTIEGRKEVAQLAAGLKAGTSVIQQELQTQRLEDLKDKAAEKKQATEMATQGRLSSFDTAIDTLDTIAKHPGKKDVVGNIAGSVLSNIPGTNAAGFASQLETFKAQTFLPQVAALKGMGALSDAEGKKLTAAVGALDPKMKQTEFDSQITKIKNDLTAARKRAAAMSPSSSGGLGTAENPIVLK